MSDTAIDPTPRPRLAGKRAVVTGGGRGIGAAVGRALAAEGAAVMLAARSTDEVTAGAEALRRGGAEAHALGCDVTVPEQVERLYERAVERMGGVDVLVNNAGIASSAPLGRTTLEEWERILAVNVTGTFLTTRTFLPAMVEHGWGRVINVASVAAKMGAAYISAYAASKHAVLGFTRAVAMEVATRGVTVNAVCPGYVDTGMTEESVERIVAKTGLTAGEAMRRLEEHSPQGRLYQPDEVAYLVVCLADPRAGGVNGQSIVLDGGSVQA